MDDLIRRQDAINELSYCQTYLFDSRDHDKKISLEDAEYTIERLPSAQQWIPCSERLPKDDETVIVTRDDGTVKIATFEVGEIENGWQIGSWYTEDNVVAWMPLPEPYKGGEKCN